MTVFKNTSRKDLEDYEKFEAHIEETGKNNSEEQNQQIQWIKMIRRKRSAFLTNIFEFC